MGLRCLRGATSVAVTPVVGTAVDAPPCLARCGSAELARRLRDLKPGIGVVFATGRDRIEGFASEPRTELLKKPYRLDLLEKVLARILD